jgi:hypothetical protein
MSFLTLSFTTVTVPPQPSLRAWVKEPPVPRKDRGRVSDGICPKAFRHTVNLTGIDAARPMRCTRWCPSLLIACRMTPPGPTPVLHGP